MQKNEIDQPYSVLRNFCYSKTEWNDPLNKVTHFKYECLFNGLVLYKILPMVGFKLRTYVIVIKSYADWATTTALNGSNANLFHFSVLAAKAKGAMEIHLLCSPPFRDGNRPFDQRLSHSHWTRWQWEIRRQTLASHHFWIANVHSGWDIAP